MEYTELRAFHLVAQERSFTRAARAIGVTQPTLSQQVKALEERYGVRLLERRGRATELTELGQGLFAITGRLRAVEEEAQAFLSGSEALTRGHLNVSADSAYHAVPILARLRRLHPALTFSINIGNSDEVLAELLAARADVAVMAKSTSDARLHSQLFRQDRLVLFVSSGHPWARRRGIRLAELAGEAMVLRERGSITREVFERALVDAAIMPGTIMDVQTREGVREAVAAGFGVGVVFESEFGRDDRVHRLAIADAPLAVGEYVVCLQQRRRLALVRAFLEAAEAVALELGRGAV
ncbi:MAG: LysR family transcriptional regulator [Proteobacteria bacterium]|nr:LysR family transcriptional regulator [Pseudomonadota bacterium]MBI3499066.1 LysR family transcriptional regulator [Pseudomonadota bacterium]